MILLLQGKSKVGVLVRDVLPVSVRLVGALEVPLLQDEGVLGLVQVIALWRAMVRWGFF